MSDDHDNPFAAGTSGAPPAPDVDVSPVPLEVGPILQRCTDLFLSRPGFLIAAILLPVVPAMAFMGVDVVLNIVTETTNDDNLQLMMQLGSFTINIAQSLLSVFFQLGLARIFLGVAYGQPVELGMLVGEGRHYLNALLATFVMFVVVFLGFIAFIIPGIIIAIGLQFVLYAMIDKELGPIEAIKESWALTDGYKGTIFLVNLVITFLGIIFSCLTLGIGYLLIVPVTALVQAVMYQSLTHLKSEAF